MSDNFKVIYKILKILESSMDYPEFDSSRLDAKNLGITQAKRDSLLTMMAKEGYIEGVEITQYIGDAYPTVSLQGVKITIRGLEYLEENSLMKKASRLAKGLVDTIK